MKTDLYVPVVNYLDGHSMPTTPSRARRMIKSGDATPFFKKGIFCIRLNKDPSGLHRQQIAVGIDPGSKKEGFTVKSAAHTYLNIQSDAVTWVKRAVKTRRMMRCPRRNRKTPCRPNRTNRSRGGLPPSTKARWQWKLRIVEKLSNVLPLTDFVVEDIKARTTEGKKRNVSFSPLQIGKTWFYAELGKFGQVHLKQGWETKDLRDAAGLKKTKKKLSEVFEAHCVDSWVLANWLVGGHVVPDNTSMLCISPIQLHRRQLHFLQPGMGGKRHRYGSTRSCGFKRGSLIAHPRWGVTYVGGTNLKRISLHSVATGKLLTRGAKPTEVRLKAYNTWRTRRIETQGP